MSSVDIDSASLVSAGQYSKSKKWLLMTVVISLGIANAFGALGGTILLGPTIQKDMKMSTDELQWLTTSFYIPLVRWIAYSHPI